MINNHFFIFRKKIFIILFVGFGVSVLALTTLAIVNNQPTSDIVVHTLNGYALPYPTGWRVEEVRKNEPLIVKFYKNINDKELGDISMTVYENPKNLTVKEFYNGVDRPNLFTDAIGGYQDVKLNDVSAIKFSDVLGFTHYTIVVVPYNDKIFEIADIGETHQSDGIFDKILSEFMSRNLTL